MNRGSEWRKWDLHVHTPASFHNDFKFDNKVEQEKYQNDIWDKYIYQLEQIADIFVIGITDYFTIDGYKKVLSNKKKGKLQNYALILPNIEFRLDKFVENRRLNYHVLFSDELEPEKIEREFLEALTFKTEKGEERKLTRKNIEEIGKKLREHQEEFRSETDYVVGCKNITVSQEEIIRVLENRKSIFDGKYLLVLPDEGWSSINWASQGHLSKKAIYMQSNLLFSSSSTTREWALGRKHLSLNDFIKEFGPPKACIHGSDAHSFEKLCKPDQNKFCWIKADPTFEGLKHIVYEPEERVRIQPESPEFRKSIYTLDSIKLENSYINDDLSIEEQEIPLNRNLVVVTGGKGDGKTALLDLIANCFEDRCKRGGEDRNSFVQRIEDEAIDLEVEIEFIEKEVGKFSKTIIENKFFNDSKITYLPQGKIEEYSGNRQKLDEKIEEIIFGNKDIIDKGYREQFDDVKFDIRQLEAEIDEINRNINQLESETTSEVMNSIETKRKIKEGELKNKKDELEKLTDSMEKGITEGIDRLKKEETALRERHSNLDDVKTKLLRFRGQLEESTDSTNKDINELNHQMSELMLNFIIPPLDFKSQLSVVTKAIDVIVEKITEVTTEIGQKRKQLSQLSGVQKEHAELLKEVEKIVMDIKDLNKHQEILKKKLEKIKSSEMERIQKHQALLSKYLEWKKYYEEVIGVFSKGKSQIMGEIDFESSIFFDKKRFIEIGSDLLDLRKITQDEIVKYAEELESLIAINSQENFVGKIEIFIEKMFSLRSFLKTTTRTPYDYYTWVFGNYFSLSTKILFKRIPMEKLSIGQKGTVLLKMFLAEGDYPLIVDQPEESLDNKFIYDELVGAFREAKKNRQVIIATNNANLVVNTDSEQIIIAEFVNNTISYASVSLENLERRQDIMTILEGGKEAFRKREEKWGI